MYLKKVLWIQHRKPRKWTCENYNGPSRMSTPYPWHLWVCYLTKMSLQAQLRLCTSQQQVYSCVAQLDSCKSRELFLTVGRNNMTRNNGRWLEAEMAQLATVGRCHMENMRGNVGWQQETGTSVLQVWGTKFSQASAGTELPREAQHHWHTDFEFMRLLSRGPSWDMLT